MNRHKLEAILRSIWTLMELLLPYVNDPEMERWADMIGEVKAIVFRTDEEA